MPPWEKYQSPSSGPWSKYAAPSAASVDKNSITQYDPKTGMPFTQAERNAGVQDLTTGMETGLKTSPFVLNDLTNLGSRVISGKDAVMGSKEILNGVGIKTPEAKTSLGLAGELVGNVAGMEGVAKGGSKLVSKAVDKIVGSPAAVKDAFSGVPKPPPPPPPAIPEANTLKAGSQATYDAAEKAGATLTPVFTDNFLSEVEKIRPQTAEGKIFAGNNEISQMIERAQGLKGRPITLKGLEEIDKELTDQVSQHFGPTGLNEQGKAILDFQDKLRDMVDAASGAEISGSRQGLDLLKQARAEWSQAARMRDIEKIITRAQQMQNPATAIKTGFRTLFNNEKRMRGFTKEEKAAIQKAAETGEGMDLLNTFGSKFIPIMHAATGGGIGGDIVSYIGAKGARNAAEALQMRRADEVRRLVANRKIPTANEAIGAAPDPLAEVQQYYKDNPGLNDRWNKP